MKCVEAVVFDLFGTLTKSVSHHFSNQLHYDMSTALGIDHDTFISLWHDTFEMRLTGHFTDIRANIEHIIQILKITVNPDALNYAITIRNDATQHVLNHLREDAVETLRKIKHMGIKLGLISDCTPEVPIIFQKADWARYFDSIIFSSVIKMKKPNPEIYLTMCQNLNCAPQKCIYVGDGGSHELSGAEHVGMFPILIMPTTNNKMFLPLRDTWEKERITTLAEVFQYIN